MKQSCDHRKQKPLLKFCVALIHWILFVSWKGSFKRLHWFVETPGLFGGWREGLELLIMPQSSHSRWININKLSTDKVQMLKLRTFPLFPKMFSTALCQTGHDVRTVEVNFQSQDHKRQKVRSRDPSLRTSVEKHSKELATEGQTFCRLSKTTDLQKQMISSDMLWVW